MEVVEVNQSNLHVYLNIGQSYAAEFAPLTNDLPDKEGRFHLDSPLEGNVRGYLLYIDNLPVGLALIASEGQGNYEIYEFYVLPSFRRNKIGQSFAFKLFDIMPGEWVSKQIAGANHAVEFWRRVIGAYTNGEYIEDMYDDAHWGIVTRQCFKVKGR